MKGSLFIFLLCFFLFACGKNSTPREVPVFPSNAEPAKVSLLQYDPLGNRRTETVPADQFLRWDIRLKSVSQQLGVTRGSYGDVRLVKPGLCKAVVTGQYDMQPTLYARPSFVAYPGSSYEIELRGRTCVVINRTRGKVVANARLR